MNFDHVNDDISTSAGLAPTLGGKITIPAQEAIKENFIIAGDLATNGAAPYQEGASGTASHANYMADLWMAEDNITFGTEPTWAQTSDGLTVTSNEATTHSSYALNKHRIEGYETTRLFALADYFVLQGQIKCGLSGKVYVSVRSPTADTSYVFPVTVSAGVSTPFAEVVPKPTSGTFGTGTNDGMSVSVVRSNNNATYQTATLNAWQAGDYISGSDQLDLHATNGATMSIDKIKIEPGRIQTPFWTPDAGEVLRQTQRYYETVPVDGTRAFLGVCYEGTSGSANMTAMWDFMTTKRAPASLVVSTAASAFTYSSTGAAVSTTGGATALAATTRGGHISFPIAATPTYKSGVWSVRGDNIGGVLLAADSRY